MVSCLYECWTVYLYGQKRMDCFAGFIIVNRFYWI